MHDQAASAASQKLDHLLVDADARLASAGIRPTAAYPAPTCRVSTFLIPPRTSEAAALTIRGECSVTEVFLLALASIFMRRTMSPWIGAVEPGLELDVHAVRLAKPLAELLHMILRSSAKPSVHRLRQRQIELCHVDADRSVPLDRVAQHRRECGIAAAVRKARNDCHAHRGLAHLLALAAFCEYHRYTARIPSSSRMVGSMPRRRILVLSTTRRGMPVGLAGR